MPPHQHPNGQPQSPRASGHGWAWAISLSISCAGLVGILVSGSILFDTWYGQWAWYQSEEQRQIERQLEAASARWARPEDDVQPAQLDDENRRPVQSTRATASSATDARRRILARPTPPPVIVPALQPTRAPDAEAQGTAIQSVRVVQAALQFIDPPGPGAHARLAVTLANGADTSGQPIVVGIPADWLDRYRIIGAIPPVLDDHAEDDGYRYFDFPGGASGTDVTVELHVVATDESVVSPAAGVVTPTVRLALRDGASLGEWAADITVPPPPPGPVRALAVPRLDIKTGVVDTGWEPPAFVAGQISSTAALGAGNAVIIGHRSGRAGNVFARLIGARLGDQIVAASHGEEQRYVVSEIRTLPGTDTTPIEPAETPRVTLMTCVGAWNPFTGDYSHRLWVVAEPPALARATLHATVARASQIAATATVSSEVTRARGEAIGARAALAVMDAEARRRP